MKKTTFTYKGIDDYALHFELWKPEGKTKSAFVLVHGLGEHSGRFSTHFAQFYTDNNYAILTFDLPGHGRSEGKRGILAKYNHLYQILDYALDRLRVDFPGIPTFIYGHSLGALITLDYAITQKPDISAVIATSPPLDVDQPLPKSKILAAKVLNILLPSVGIKTGLVTDVLSKDESVVRAYLNDPIVHDIASARLGMYIIERGEFVRENPEKLSVPALLMVGTSEANVSQTAIHQFASGSALCEEKTWPGLYHELHNEPEKDMVFEFAERWMDVRIKP